MPDRGRSLAGRPHTVIPAEAGIQKQLATKFGRDDRKLRSEKNLRALPESTLGLYTKCGQS